MPGRCRSTKRSQWRLGLVCGGLRRGQSRGRRKRLIFGVVVDDDGGVVAVSIHGPGRIFEQPRLGQRWPLAPWTRATPSAADMALVAGRHGGEERSRLGVVGTTRRGRGGGVLSLAHDQQITENDIVAVSSGVRP
jgi:hypothetical protein